MIDRIQVRTISLVAAVVMAAAGLNLAVLGLDSDDEGDQLATLGDDSSDQLDATGNIPSELPLGTDVTDTPLPLAETPRVGPPSAPQPADGSSSDNGDPTAGQSASDGSTNPSQGTEPAPNGSGSHNPTGGSAAGKSAPPDPATTKPAAPTTTAKPTNPPAPSPTPAPTATPTTPAPTTASVEYKTYEFDGVASEIVIAVYSDNSLEFWSVKVESGWQYQVEKAKGREVKIEFRRGSDDDEAKFVIKSENGRLKTEQEK